MKTVTAPVRKNYKVAGGTLSAVHYGPIDSPPQIVLLHANGFNAYSYKSLLENLDVHTIAIDLRGQGQSTDFTLDVDRLKSFHPFAKDISQFLREYIEQPVVIVGHSLGGVVGMLAAQNTPEKVRGYLGFDPVTVPLLIRTLPRIPGGSWIMKNGFDWAKKAGKRRSKFASYDAAFAHYNGRGTFKFLPDEAVRDYLTGGLIAGNDGSVRLSCDPLWEQAVYGAQAQDVYGAAKALPAHSKIVFAGIKPASTPGTRARMVRSIGTDKVVFHADYSHFFPLIKIEQTLDYLKEALS